MDKKLFVGNLPYRTSEEALQKLFAGAGTVASVELIKDRESGRSKGFAFVTMGSQSEMEKAIQMFNGYMLEERALVVNIARPREDRGPGGPGGPGGRRGGPGGGNRPGGRNQQNRNGGNRRF